MSGAQGAPVSSALQSLADPVFLHQVVEVRGDGSTRRFLDLPAALLAFDPRDREHAPREWRIHHHVPLHLARLGAVETTQDVLLELLDQLAARGELPALEAETYTWSVLPRRHRAEHVADDLARELTFVRDHLATRRGPETPRPDRAAFAE